MLECERVDRRTAPVKIDNSNTVHLARQQSSPLLETDVVFGVLEDAKVVVLFLQRCDHFPVLKVPEAQHVANILQA